MSGAKPEEPKQTALLPDPASLLLMPSEDSREAFNKKHLKEVRVTWDGDTRS